MEQFGLVFKTIEILGCDQQKWIWIKKRATISWEELIVVSFIRIKVANTDAYAFVFAILRLVDEIGIS